MMSKKILLRACLLGISLVLATTCIISNTFAKYTTTINLKADTNVAKWSFSVENTDIYTSNTFTFGLYDTVKYSDMDGIADLGTKNLIAPGTVGEFVVDLNNTSDVSAMCEMTLKPTYSNLPSGVSKIPLEFSFDGTNYSANPAKYTVSSIASKATKTVTVYWRWPASGHSATDKLLQTSTAKTTVQLTVVASQMPV